MRNFDHKGLWPGLGVFGAGALCVFGFAPFHIWPITLIGLSFLFVRLHGVSKWARAGRAGFRTGLLFGLGWFSASCFWIASAFFERGPEFLPLVPPLVGGLAIVLSLFWAVAAWGAVRVLQRAPLAAGAAAFVSAFMLAELARGHILSGFPWNMAGYSFAPGGWASQAAHLIGVYGLTMVLYVVAALLGWAWIAGRVRPAAGAALVLAALFAYGGVRLNGASVDYHDDVRLRLVSVSFRQSEKINPITARQVTERFIEQSVQPGIEEVTHLIWPEGAVNGIAIDDASLLRAMGYLLTQNDSTPPVWLMNSLRMEMTPDLKRNAPRRVYYNSSVAITFDAAGTPTIAATNDKHKLVPFGEFIPGGRIVEDMGAKLVSTAIASITPAPEKRLSEFPGLPTLSPQICYEVIFPGLTPRTLNGRRPELILNQSNDAWFGATMGPAQHAAIARYRAIEESLPMIRSAANGVTGVFDAYGRSVDATFGHSEIEGAFYRDTPLPKSLNSYVSHKFILLILLLLNLVLFLISARIHRVS